ncbi:MAG: hypothetical protein H6635_05360 [Anaerolineales bacterium]|nr:hypothetical protein [Anaerolineales bacterium]MCB9144777.1 hypothetical protein [Anaerolineales bacterium]
MIEHSTATTCYAHPGRETTLRCKRCEKYICTSCAVGTPTGYMCKDCVNERKKIFDTALWYDYLIGFGITFVMSLVASILAGIAASFIGFYMIFFAAAVGGAAGVFISNITLRAINKRRSKTLFYACTAGVVLGALPVALVFFFFDSFAGFAIVVFAVITTPVVYRRVSGIQL